MPWRVTSPMYQRQRFVLDAEHTPASFAELCRRYGISRKTGYKWLDRYARLGPESLADRSHRPAAVPPRHRARGDSRDPPAPPSLALGRPQAPRAPARRASRRAGARPSPPFIGSSCATAASAAAGAPRSAPIPAGPRPRSPGPTWSGRSTSRASSSWAMAATAIRSRSRTPTPAISWPARGSRGRCSQPTQQVFRRLFRTYGLPERIRSDNGQPFASCALGRLSQLSVWWLRLGIRPELIEPASPHQNGRHERMHRDLKAETTRPAAPSLGAQQRRFDAFRRTFNEVRPHEALHQRRPAALYTPSDRLYVPRLRPITYPEHFEIRRVSTNGGIRWNKRWVNVSHILATLPRRPRAARQRNLECVLWPGPPGLAR